MKTIPAALIAHNAEEVVTYATCLLAELTDGTVVGVTSHSSDLVIGGITYQASAGYTPSSVQTTGNLAVPNLECMWLLDGTVTADEDLLNGLWDYARITFFEVNYNDLAAGVNYLREGILGEVRAGRVTFEAELLGLSQAYQQTIGRLVLPGCDAEFGDARCGVNKAIWTVTGTVTSATSARHFTDSSRAEAAGHFTNGSITWTSGANVGLSMEVKTSDTGGVIALVLPMRSSILVGDAYSMVAGCQKRYTEDCDAKFGNWARFRGFPHLPGLDRLMSGT